jgi:hypothetical protein
VGFILVPRIGKLELVNARAVSGVSHRPNYVHTLRHEARSAVNDAGRKDDERILFMEELFICKVEKVGRMFCKNISRQQCSVKQQNT